LCISEQGAKEVRKGKKLRLSPVDWTRHCLSVLRLESLSSSRRAYIFEKDNHDDNDDDDDEDEDEDEDEEYSMRLAYRKGVYRNGEESCYARCPLTFAGSKGL